MERPLTWLWQRRLILLGALLGLGLFVTEAWVNTSAFQSRDWLDHWSPADTLSFWARLSLLVLPALLGVYADRLLRAAQRRADNAVVPLQPSFSLAAAAFESTDQGVFVTDRSHRIVSVNPAFLESSGFSKQEVVGKHLLDLKSDRHNEAFYQNIFSSLKDRGRWRGEAWNRRRDGVNYPVWQTVSPIHDPDKGNVTHYVFVFSDISPIKRHQANKDLLAYHDPLTGLPNRLVLGERLDHALRVRARLKSPIALLFLDLDGFKAVNDTYGHRSGDQLLQAVAQRLHATLRDGDTVARFGGDEFVVLVESCDSRSGIMRVAEKIIEQITQPLQLGDSSITVQTSIGIAVGPTDGADSATLIQAADQAMYNAKTRAGSCYSFYEETRGAGSQTDVTQLTQCFPHAL
jgi:diguanylate cyclase (GGDEF)-like protein/PAS domain S-box-containing protein